MGEKCVYACVCIKYSSLTPNRMEKDETDSKNEWKVRGKQKVALVLC